MRIERTSVKINNPEKHRYIVIPITLIFAFGVLNTSANTTTLSQNQQDQKTQLELQLGQIENQISLYQQQLSSLAGQKNTLNNKIRQLNIQQNQLKLQIQETTLNVQNIQAQIEQTSALINDNQNKITVLNTQISDLVTQIYEQDQSSPIQLLLSNDGIGGYSDQLTYQEKLNSSLASLIDQTKTQTEQLQNQKQQLTDQEQQQNNLISIQTLQNISLDKSLTDQNTLLQKTRGIEANYQVLLNGSQQQANQIRGRIYELFGSPSNVTFGAAVQIAQWASSQTGVRPAFLLAILTQESNLGKNVGTCNRPGDPPQKSWKAVMKPDRDQQPFLQITSELGLDPNTTPVSCPMHDSRGRQIGWGGAMGPAQFIPSTWIAYKEQIKNITGQPANPWDIRDAFIAAAIKLKADGGDSVNGEWAAAMRYFSGSTNPKYSFYGNNVMAIAQGYQQDIDNINKQ